MTVPSDPALPQLGLLLDPDAMAPLLERSLGRPARLDAVHVARVSYKPGERVCVHYTVDADGSSEDAVARAVAGRADARTRVTWLPLDPGLPALASLAGRLLSYRPGRRAVLRRNRQVLKVYGSTARYESAAAALRAGPTLSLPTPRPGVFRPELRVTTQAAVDGTPVSAREAAGEAGALLRRLRHAEPRALTPARESPLETVARKAALVAVVVPSLAGRVAALARRLAREQPPLRPPVPAHGDFHAGQLLRAKRELVVVDLDGLCVGDAALDLAEYAAAATDDRTAILDTLLEGYGERPAGLEWHLAAAVLIRASHPFHRQLPEWPARVEATVADVEAILAGQRR